MKNLTSQERTALAMLTCGRSFEEASDSTHVSYERLKDLWDQQMNAYLVKPDEVSDDQ